MRKLLAIGIGVLFLSTTVAAAYSRNRDLFPTRAEKVESEMFRQIRVHPEFKQLKWKVARLRKYAGGMYDTKTDTVTIDDRTNLFAIRKIVSHEYAHYVWLNELDQVQRDSYCRLYDYFQDSVSDYGLESCVENFAEGFSSIHYNARWTHGRGFSWRGTYARAREFFVLTRQGEFINNLQR